MNGINNLSADMLHDVTEAVWKNLDSVILVDKKAETYLAVKLSPNWEKVLDAEGQLEHLFFVLFTTQADKNTTEGSNYSAFIDTKVFEKDNYQGIITLGGTDGVESYVLYIDQMQGDKAIITLRSTKGMDKAQKIELDKIDAIQEEFLFSMIVNLKDDSCINPNTTEISSNRQDYLDLKYSEWRLMICNMFRESDREIFLRMTSPEYVINTLEDQPKFEFELPMMNILGKFIWSKLTFTRMKSFTRENPKFVFTVKDVEKDMQRLLKQESIIEAVERQKEKLEQSNRERIKYFSSMSHEIRTPINAILGMNEVILREATEENIISYARDIKTSSKFLLSIINDILDYSKIEAGKMEIIPVEYNPWEMFEEIGTLIRSRISDKSIEYKVSIDEKLPMRLYGDKKRIEQVIINILTNAVKYTPEGSVSMKIEVQDVSGKFNLKVSVTDTGIGIKAEDMDRMFGDYVRLDNQKNANIEGTGLGMSIVVSLLEQMGSHLEVESVYMEGSTFSFVLPQKVVEGEPAKSSKYIQLPDKKILVGDDTSINLRVMKAMLGAYSIQVDFAENGKQCLDKLENNHYDLVFLDHMMPEMDGLETIKNIRARGAEFAALPVIALTGMSDANSSELYHSAGFNDYLEKPITRERLENVIKTFLIRS